MRKIAVRHSGAPDIELPGVVSSSDKAKFSRTQTELTQSKFARSLGYPVPAAFPSRYDCPTDVAGPEQARGEREHVRGNGCVGLLRTTFGLAAQ